MKPERSIELIQALQRKYTSHLEKAKDEAAKEELEKQK